MAGLVEDDGHAVVDLGGEFVGFGGDNGAAADDFFFGRGPFLPESGHGERAIVGHVQVVRDFTGVGLLPLVVAAGRY